VPCSSKAFPWIHKNAWSKSRAVKLNYHERIRAVAYVQDVLNLVWHVDPEGGYPIATNPEIKLNDMEIVKSDYEYCGSLYRMFRGNGWDEK